MKNVTGGGVKWVDVTAERFPGWIASFAVRHGVSEDAVTATAEPDQVTFATPAGAAAQCHPPFAESFRLPDRPDLSVPDAVAALAAHAALPRTVGVLLVRLGGYAAGVFEGYPPVLADAKAGSRPVHGRSAAGGWSQHRFARRREKQAGEALGAAADAAVLVFGRRPPGRPGLDAVVLGGDRRAVDGLQGDPRLARYLALATERFLTVPDPRRSVLESAAARFTAVRVRITEPSP